MQQTEPAVTLALHAMATRFEIVLPGEDAPRLRAAGEEALAEIERLEAQLSFYRPTSEISRLNTHAANAPVRVEPALFRLLQHALRLSAETGGAFDITVAPLMRAWGFTKGSGQLPDPHALAEAKLCTGWRNVELDEREFTVRFARPGVMLDLGAIGKGYALERAAAILRDDGITSALLHGGTSTVCAIGAPPDADAWKVAIQHPDEEVKNQECRNEGNGGDNAGSTESKSVFLPSCVPDEKLPRVLATIPLRDESLSVSAVWGKSFTVDARVYGHVIDPRTGAPTQGAQLAAVVLPSATETDALSTALLTLGLDGVEQITARRPGMRALVAGEEGDTKHLRLAARGITVA